MDLVQCLVFSAQFSGLEWFENLAPEAIRGQGGPGGVVQAQCAHQIPLETGNRSARMDWGGGLDRQSGSGAHCRPCLFVAGSHAAVRQPQLQKPGF